MTEVDHAFGQATSVLRLGAGVTCQTVGAQPAGFVPVSVAALGHASSLLG